MIDQIILNIAGKDMLFMVSNEKLFVAEGVRFGGFFSFDPNQRLEIRPVSWKTADILPLCEHERELRQLLSLKFQLAEQSIKEAN
jgi:hypothetical protein